MKEPAFSADRCQGGWGMWGHKLLITKMTMALALTVGVQRLCSNHRAPGVKGLFFIGVKKKIFPQKKKNHQITIKKCFVVSF